MNEHQTPTAPDASGAAPVHAGVTANAHASAVIAGAVNAAANANAANPVATVNANDASPAANVPPAVEPDYRAMYESMRKENEVLRHNAEIAQSAPVRGVTGGGNALPADDFLRGFDSDEW